MPLHSDIIYGAKFTSPATSTSLADLGYTLYQQSPTVQGIVTTNANWGGAKCSYISLGGGWSTAMYTEVAGLVNPYFEARRGTAGITQIKCTNLTPSANAGLPYDAYYVEVASATSATLWKTLTTSTRVSLATTSSLSLTMTDYFVQTSYQDGVVKVWLDGDLVFNYDDSAGTPWSGLGWCGWSGYGGPHYAGDIIIKDLDL